jgi:hypothetical protein
MQTSPVWRIWLLNIIVTVLYSVLFLRFYPKYAVKPLPPGTGVAQLKIVCVFVLAGLLIGSLIYMFTGSVEVSVLVLLAVVGTLLLFGKLPNSQPMKDAHPVSLLFVTTLAALFPFVPLVFHYIHPERSLLKDWGLGDSFLGFHVMLIVFLLTHMYRALNTPPVVEEQPAEPEPPPPPPGYVHVGKSPNAKQP